MKISRVSSTAMLISAKRASASDSSAVDVDKVEFSPLKKYKVDEEDDVYIEDEGSEEGEEGDGSEGSLDYDGLKDIPEPNPQWDVDSYEGVEWESDPELRAEFSDDEDYMSWRTERIKAFEDKGFLPDRWKGIYAIQFPDRPGCRDMTNWEYLVFIASLCVNKLNEDKGKTVEFVSIVRGNMTVGPIWKLYITFMAREYPNGPLVEYQAKAMDFNRNYDRPPFPILCRPAIKPTI